ncbi:MAG: hypothetical protein IPK25_05595 [Saprospiraceae bacterium]|nr:hypothetical protein [Saprospiraceae bacterium]
MVSPLRGRCRQVYACISKYSYQGQRFTSIPTSITWSLIHSDLSYFLPLFWYYTMALLGWINKKGCFCFSATFFYGLWNPPLIILLWLSTMVDWIAGNKLHTEENQKRGISG